MIINSGDKAPISLWEEYDFLEVNSVTGLLELTPLTPSVIQYQNVVESDDVTLEYNKRLHYLNEDMIAQFLTDELWAELIRVYLKYLNDKIYQEIVRLDEMIHEDDWFIEAFYDQFSGDLIADDIVSLTIEDKEKIYKISKFLGNLKGVKLSFQTLLGLLNQDMILNKEGKKVFENSILGIIESRDFNSIDPEPNPKLFRHPFTYGYESNDPDFDSSEFYSIMESVHPIGFSYILNDEPGFDRTELIPIPKFDLNFYALRTFRWNGLYDRSGYLEINNKEYSLQNTPILLPLGGGYEWERTLEDI